MLQLDPTTQAALEVAKTPTLRATAIISSLSGTITVTVYDGDGNVKGSGTMPSLGTQSGNVIVLGTTSDFVVSETGTPDPSTWTIKFANGSGRYIIGSFGYSTNPASEFKWSLDNWTLSSTGNISNAYLTVKKKEVLVDVSDTYTVTGISTNTAPYWLQNFPTTLTLAAGATYNFAGHAADDDGQTLTFTKVSGNGTITSAGVYTAGTTGGSLVLRVSDGSLTATSPTCTVTVGTLPDPTAVIFKIPVTMSSFDGSGVQAKVGGGTAVPNTLAAQGQKVIIEIERGTGTRSPPEILNLVGTESNWITVRGDPTGLVTMRRGDAGGGFIGRLRGLRYVHIDGYNPSVTSERGCGLKFMYSSYNGVTAPTSFLNVSDLPTVLTSFIKISYVSIDGGHAWPIANSKTTNGIGIQINDHSTGWTYSGNQKNGVPTKYREGITVENCWIRNVQGEGIYCGPNWRWTTPTYTPSDADDIPLRDIILRYNRLENIGGDVINYKAWIAGDNRIHGNYIYNGTTEMGADGNHVVGGINGSCHVKIYDNYIEKCAGPAISTLIWEMPSSLPFGPFVSEIYNNVCVDIFPTPVTPSIRAINVAAGDTLSPSGESCLQVQAKVYNNTVAEVTGIGISTARVLSGSFIRNNIVAGATGTAISAGPSETGGNWTGTVANAKFVNAAGRDFRLQADSPAIGLATTNFPSTDIAGAPRPQGNGADSGAYEYSVDNSSYTRIGTIAENAWETGSIASAASKIDGVWASATRDVGYVDSTSYLTTTGGGFGSSTDYDIRVVSSYQAPTTPNGVGEIVYPRAGSYFLMTKIHKDKDYRGVNGADPSNPAKYNLLDDGTMWYQATPPAGRSWQYDKPRVQCNMIQDIKRWFWDEYAWFGFSIYLPANLEYDLGVADHRSGNALFTVSPNVYQTEASFLTLQYRRPSSSINVAHWMVDLITGVCELETDPAAVNSTHDLGSIADDRGRWTDFVFRWRFNPYTVASTYRGFSFTANGGSLEVWKSTGAPFGPNNDRAMTKVLTRTNQPIGMLPGSDTDSIRLSGLRQYKYSWKRASANSTVVGPIMIGYDQAYIGREALGAGFRDVHPTKMTQP